MGSKIEQKSIQKGIEKVNVLKSSKNQKKSNYIRDSQLMGGFQGRGRAKGKPLPEGRGEGVSGLLPVLYAKPPQPKGWWDYRVLGDPC